MGRLSNQIAMVTGAGRGIGRAIAEALAAEGADVALLARSPGELEQSAAACTVHGVRALAIPTDLTTERNAEAAVESCRQGLGDPDILVNNAGVFSLEPAYEGDLGAWNRLLTLNLHAAMWLTRLTLPAMRTRRRGAVIQIASLAGLYTSAGMAAYCASKHGLIGFSGSVFEDVRDDGIKVSSLCPGWTATQMMQGSGVDPSSVIQPEAVAAAVIFVATFPASGCPVLIELHPQASPRRLEA